MGGVVHRWRHRAGARSPKSLILQAADYAERKGEAPRELEIYFDWQAFGLPYHSGGLVDQPYALMSRLRVARNVYEAIRTWKESKDWQSLQIQQPRLWSIVESVVMLRQEIEHGR